MKLNTTFKHLLKRCNKNAASLIFAAPSQDSKRGFAVDVTAMNKELNKCKELIF